MAFRPEGVVHLAKVGLLPKISLDDIRERSKSDTFAKLIVCTQVTWFLFQSFARVATRLPLTLLEVHTMTHIACALLIYATWWMKPYGIESPILIEDPRISNFVALHDQSYKSPGPNSQEQCAVQYDEHSHKQRNRESSLSSVIPSKVRDAMRDLRERRCHITWKAGVSNDGINLTDRCSDFMVEVTPFLELNGRIDVDEDDEDNSSLPANAAALLFSGFYGGSHLSAWAFHFATSVEMWIWRVCGIGLCTTPILLGMSWLLQFLERTDRVYGMEDDSMLARLLFIPFYLLLKFYGAARVFLLVESLASFRSPANGTYDTVEWTSFIPHFS